MVLIYGEFKDSKKNCIPMQLNRLTFQSKPVFCSIFASFRFAFDTQSLAFLIRYGQELSHVSSMRREHCLFLAKFTFFLHTFELSKRKFLNVTESWCNICPILRKNDHILLSRSCYAENRVFQIETHTQKKYAVS